MRKILSVILAISFSLSLFSCNTKNNDVSEDEVLDMTNTINIFTINDFHGAIFEDGEEAGFSKIGDFLIKQKAKFPDSTIIISAGDMFQGTAVSSMSRGKSVVDIMNEIGFDAMTLGNHEFDWGIDGITRYVDSNSENGEIKFPFLGANILQLDTNSTVNWAKPYTVINRQGLKIGIIGILDESLKSDILTSIVSNYEFTDKVQAIKKYTEILRTEEDCDIVIVSAHANTEIINRQLRDFTGNYKIDAIINGHTHQYYFFEESGDRVAPLAGVQTGSNGKYIGQITLKLDSNSKEIIDAYAGLINTSIEFKDENLKINQIISNYSDNIEISKAVLGKAGESISQQEATKWAANMIKTYSNTDIGLVNSGGIRASAFPIDINEEVTFGHIYKMMPFENTIVTLSLTGAQLMDVISNNKDLYSSSNLNVSEYTINGEKIIRDKLYSISTMDFVFERSNTFKTAVDIVFTNYLFRDHLVNEVKRSVNQNGKWYLNK